MGENNSTFEGSYDVASGVKSNVGRWTIETALPFMGTTSSTTVGTSNENIIGFSYNTVGDPELAAASLAMVGTALAASLVPGRSLDATIWQKFTTIIPVDLEILYGDSWEVNLFTSHSFVLGMETYNNGGAYDYIRGNKYETQLGDSYVMMSGTEYHVEDNPTVKRRSLIGTFFSAGLLHQTYHDNIQVTSEETTEIAAGGAASLEAEAEVTVEAGGDLNLGAAAVASLSADGEVAVEGGSVTIVADETVMIGSGEGSLVVEDAGVVAGGTFEAGLPGPAAAAIEDEENDVAEELAAGQAAAASAEAEADAAMAEEEGMIAKTLSYLASWLPG